MTGKIFKESSNIYDDQARILFDYYKKAAEKIVAEEIAIEEKIASEERVIEDASVLLKKHRIFRTVFAVLTPIAALSAVLFFVNPSLVSAGSSLLIFLGALTLGFGIALITSIVRISEDKKTLASATARLEELKTDKDAIRRDYKVSKLGVAYVPVATQIPFEGRSFVVDHTGSTKNTEFSLSVLRQPEELQKSLAELEQGISRVPAVEGNTEAEEMDTSAYSISIQNVTMHDYMGNISRQVRNISYLLGDSDDRRVSLPVVEPDSAQNDFLNEYATVQTDGKPVLKVFDTSEFDGKLQNFTALNHMKKQLEETNGGDSVAYFKRLMRRLGDTVQIVSQVKTNSTSRLLNYTNGILAAVLKAGYNQYSPVLEAQEIERIREASFNYEDSVETYRPFSLKASSRVKYDLFNGVWVAEDSGRTNMPFGMNQIQEEVLMPVINNLMNETRVERLKIYNSIKDQKTAYLTKWNQDIELAFRDNRKAGFDLVRDISTAFAEYSEAHSNYMTYKDTMDSMKATGSLASGEVQERDDVAEQVAAFEMQANQCNAVGIEFQAYMERLDEDIQRKSEKFARVEYYEASLRDCQSRDMARSLDPEHIRTLDERRKKLLAINSYCASFAELPPEVNVEDSLSRDFTLDLQTEAQAQLARVADAENAEAQSAAEAPAPEGE